ncbi:MAG TPA: hypothetical protein DDY31_15235 [Lachnospiraceae bacterium]|nr:hypothetical protein [Lachnospiraceae bacterium]
MRLGEPVQEGNSGWKNKKKETAVKDYTTVEGQLKIIRGLLLATTLLLAVVSIRCHSQYLEMKEKYQLLAESNQLLLEQYQVLAESDRLLFESNQLLLESNRLILEQQQMIREIFGLGQLVPEEIWGNIIDTLDAGEVADTAIER